MIHLIAGLAVNPGLAVTPFAKNNHRKPENHDSDPNPPNDLRILEPANGKGKGWHPFAYVIRHIYPYHVARVPIGAHIAAA